MLSQRGQRNVSDLSIPWRYVNAGPLGCYHPDSNPSGVLTQFTSAENYLVQDEIAAFIDAKVQIPVSAYGYAYSSAGGERLPAALAAHLNREWEPREKLRGEDVKITAAATALHEILGFSLFDEGQGIMTSTPYYGRFEIDFGLKAGVKIVVTPTTIDECFEPNVVDVFEKTLQRAKKNGIEVKALLITNPHNPLGRCYPKDTLLALMHFCQTHHIHLLSDEIYAPTVFSSPDPNTHPFTSVLALNSTIDPDLLHVIYGTAKGFIPGLRIGALITRNVALKKAYTSIVRFHGVSGPAVVIAATMLEDQEWCEKFLELSRERIREAYVYFIKRLNSMQVRHSGGVNAGLFVYIDLSPWLEEDLGQGRKKREQELAGRALEKGLFLQPIEEHAVEVGWFRVVYTLEKRVLEEGLRRLEGLLKEKGQREE